MAEKNKKPVKKAVKAPVTKKERREILKEESSKLEVLAQKVAMQTLVEAQLELQVELTDEQNAAAKLLSDGHSFDDAARQIHKLPGEVKNWMGIPAFARKLKELTVKEGVAEKDERVRIAKRMVSAAWDEMISRIEDGELSNMTFATLEKFMLTWSQRIDSLIDKDETTKVVNNGLSVLILKHVQSNTGRHFDTIDDFLGDDTERYPTIDVEAMEVIQDD